jgi:hypothetical protein
MMRRTHWRPNDERPSWVRRISWLWDQCDVEYRTDTAERAWVATFGEALPPLRIYDGHEYRDNPYWIALHDVGDAIFFLSSDGRVFVCSYPGNCSIGVVKGPGVSL